MTDWLDALTITTAPAVLVTVAAVQGSGPREPGAKMVFTETAQYDTIGGGHLEMKAAETARAMLASGTAARRLERYPLGPSLGQCCGGVVQLAFEVIDELVDPALRGHVEALAAQWRARGDSWRVVALDGGAPPSLLDARGRAIAGPAAPVAFDCTLPAHVVAGADGKRWLVDPCRAYRPHLVLFGAGHVGAAIVRALAHLPCHVTWVDEREDMFPADLPANVRIEATDIPEAVVGEAPPGASFLVMTHSHALDQRLAECILRRRDIGWFGLIGSKTKRMQFERRLRERGIAAERLAGMTCPIGIPGIAGKQPAVIAASVAAQLLQVWEAAQQVAGNRHMMPGAPERAHAAP
jgi:xanthine dehydrogenase accessory factor